MSDSLREALERIVSLEEQQPGLKALVSEMRATARAALSAPQAEAEAVAYVPLSQAPSSAGEPLWRETFAAKWRDKGTWRGFALQALYTAPPSQSAQMRKALEALDKVEEQMTAMRSLKGWRMNLIRDHLRVAREALSRADEGEKSEGGEDPFVHGAEDEAYALGKRDGYESAIQDIDLATGGDGEFKGSTIPGETVDVPAMKARIIARFADEGKESEGGLNRQARNPAGLPDSSGDLASAGGIAGVDVTDHRRQVGSDAPSDPDREAIELERLRSVASAAQGLLNADTYVSDVPREQAVSLATMKLAQALGTWQLHHGACKADAILALQRGGQ